MAGKSPVTADAEQRSALVALSHSRDRGEADRARAILLTLSGWTSRQIAEAFGVREDTVRFWRSAFITGGIEALKKSIAPGPAPVKAECALAVAEEVLSGPVADRPNWTLPRLADEIETRAGVRISRSRLSVVLRKKGISLAATPPHAERPPGRGRRGPGGPAPKAAQGPGRGGRHRASVRRRVRSAHPSLSGARLGQERGRSAHSSAGPKRQSGAARRARLGASRAHCSDQPNQTKLRLHRSPGGDRPPLWSQAQRRDPAPRSGPRQRSDPHQQGDSCRPRRAGSLAQGRVAAEICSGAERYRGSLARPQAASSRSPDLRRTGRPRSGHPRRRQETQYRTKPPSVG